MAKVRFEQRMTEAEALMWACEDDPVLRSSFANVTLLDRPLDVPRFRARMALVVERVPRLRHRVSDPPGIAAPRWVDDPLFDLDHHIRHVALPAPGTERQLFDLATALAADPFDRARPLWQFVLVDGLEGGRGAMIQRFHHTVIDGEAGVRISASFLDLDRDGTLPMLPEGEDVAEHDGGFWPIEAVRRPVQAAGRVVAETVGDPVGAARSVLRQVAVTEPARSPLWAERSLRRRLDHLHVPLDRVKAAAGNLGGTVNDVFVTAAVGGAGSYHRARDVEIDLLRMAMPVSTRRNGGDGANAFAPMRLLVPAGTADPIERFVAIQGLVHGLRQEGAAGVIASLAGVLASLPGPVVQRLARQQVGTVDFTTSNVRGAPLDVYAAGAQVVANVPLGPMAGTAFNLTTLSVGNCLDMGLLVDTAAVGDPDLLRDCVEESFEELLLAAGA